MTPNLTPLEQELLEALKPFAAVADYWIDAAPADDPVMLSDLGGPLGATWDLTPGHFRRAASAISKAEQRPSTPSGWEPIETSWPVGDQVIIVTDGCYVGPGWFHARDESWIDCEGITPTHWMPWPSPPTPSGEG